MSSSKATLNHDSGKAEEGSKQSLLSLKRPPCDCDKKRRKRTAKILFGLLFLLIIGLCGLLTALYIKTTKLEQYWNELEMSEVVQQTELEHERQLLFNMGSPEKSGTDQEGDGGRLTQDAVLELSDDDEIEKVLNILLVGSSLHLSLRKQNPEVQFQEINLWQKKNDGISDDRHSVFTLTNKTVIEIREDGLYTIYGQLSWRMKSGSATYRIQRLTKGSSSAETLAQCVTTFPEKYAILESCYTSVTAQLKSGDRLVLVVLRNNLTIDFEDGKSFFGVTQILGNPELHS